MFDYLSPFGEYIFNSAKAYSNNVGVMSGNVPRPETDVSYGPSPDGSVISFENPHPEYQPVYDWFSYVNKLEDEAIKKQQDFNLSSANKAMEFSASEAKKNRDWQEYMSNTAYQRAMTDLRRAGLNPILAYTQGSASTPSGSTGTGYSTSSAKAEYNKENLPKAIYELLTNTAVEYARISSQALTGMLNSLGSMIPG